MKYDYGIIGGGPAGYTFAILQAKQGKKVVIFEKDKIGGTCLNYGCIPTKTMLHLSEEYKTVMYSSDIGLDICVKNFNFQSIIDKRTGIIEKLRRSLETSIKKLGIEIVYAEAVIKDSNTILTSDNEYIAEQIIIATGSKPRELSNLKFDGSFILNSDDLLNLKELPKSVLIVGSGAIGLEWARIFSNFGTEVFIVELAEHLLPVADIEVSKRVERIFKQNKIKFYLNDSIINIDNKIVTLKSNVVLEPDFILSAVGRSVDVSLSKINNTMLLGDVCSEIQLAHYAIHHAKEVALNIPFNKKLVPSIIYGEPEIAWLGKREQDCDETYKKLVMPISALGKSWCDDSVDGFIKFILKDNYIVGAHIVSKEASSLIHTILIAIQNDISIDKLKESCFAHPTYSEGIFELLMKD